MPYETPPMGMLNLQQRARQGDPQAIQLLQELGGGGMPPQQPGMVPPGQGQLSPQGGMSQSQFGGGGQPVPADAQARKAKMLIEMLRRRDQSMGPMQQGY